MGFKWIVDDFNSRNINPYDSGDIVTTPATSSSNKIYKIFNWSLNQQCVFSSNNFRFEFRQPITILQYRIRVPYSVRYLTGWKIEAIYKTKSSIIDERNEKMCTKDYIHDGCTDCGEATTRTFNANRTKLNALNLILTKKDSCGTTNIEFSGIDFYASYSNADACDRKITSRCSNRLSTTLLLYIFTVR